MQVISVIAKVHRRVSCAVFSVQCAVCSVQCAVSSVQPQHNNLLAWLVSLYNTWRQSGTRISNDFPL